MKKTMTKKWLEKHDACRDGVEAFLDQPERDTIKLLQLGLKLKKYDWTVWLMGRLMTKKQNVALSIFAAEPCIKQYENVYPEDKRPRLAIEAAKQWLKTPTSAAASAAWSAAWETIIKHGIKLLKRRSR